MPKKCLRKLPHIYSPSHYPSVSMQFSELILFSPQKRFMKIDSFLKPSSKFSGAKVNTFSHLRMFCAGWWSSERTLERHSRPTIPTPGIPGLAEI